MFIVRRITREPAGTHYEYKVSQLYFREVRISDVIVHISHQQIMEKLLTVSQQLIRIKASVWNHEMI